MTGGSVDNVRVGIFTLDFAVNTITRRLVQWNSKDVEAWDALLPQVYDELKLKARQLLSRHKHNTLQPTLLVHELYLEFRKVVDPQWQCQQHFFAVVALAMRQIVVDAAIKRNSAKRGGNFIRVTQADVEATDDRALSLDVIDLNKALEKMEDIDVIACRIIELRFFAGLSVEEIAQILEVSERTVARKWTWAKTWLFARLRPMT